MINLKLSMIPLNYDNLIVSVNLVVKELMPIMTYKYQINEALIEGLN